MLKLNEIFETIQGEGTHTGTPSVFIRLQSCDVGCAFCDTKHTWHLKKGMEDSIENIVNKKVDSPTYATITVDELHDLIIDKFVARNIVITGGEPCLYDLTELTNDLIENSFKVQIETSGTEFIRCHYDTFVTVSPKINMAGKKSLVKQAISRANEIKFPIGKQKDVSVLIDFLEEYGITDKPVYLQPLSQNLKATQLCIDTATNHDYKISVQTHKYIGLR